MRMIRTAWNFDGSLSHLPLAQVHTFDGKEGNGRKSFVSRIFRGFRCPEYEAKDVIMGVNVHLLT